MKRNHILCLAFAASLVACGGKASDPNALVSSGLDELRYGDPGAAAAQLDRALPDLDPADPDFVRAQVGLAEALASFDPVDAQQRFLAFAQAHPDLVPAQLYRNVAEGMFKAGAKVEAVDVLGAGCVRFPDDGDLEAAKDGLAARAQAKATPDELAKLESLGYLGGD